MKVSVDNARLMVLLFGGVQGYVEVSAGGLKESNRHWGLLPDVLTSLSASYNTGEFFFGPAVRSAPGKMGKSNCKGSSVVWVDIDREDMPLPVLPPTAYIWSGHGWHLYWRLDEFASPEEVEKVNTALAKSIGGDSAHNIDRMLRMPGSWNMKDPKAPVQCNIVELVEGRVYSLHSLQLSTGCGDKLVNKIVAGDRRGFRSRSERDWSVVQSLVSKGFNDSDIKNIFSYHLCGDKYAESGDSYLEHTIQKARESEAKQPHKAPDDESEEVSLIEEDSCYYIRSGRNVKQITTFVIEPTLLLEGEEEDTIVGDVKARGTTFVWKDQVFPRSAFNNSHALSKTLTKACWVWLGREGDAPILLAHLIKQLQEKDVPRAVATNIIGRHHIPNDSRTFYVTGRSAIASDGSMWTKPSEAPIMYIDEGREAPDLVLEDRGFGPSEAGALCTLLPFLNRPDVIWPVIGWFMATPIKPAIEECGYRFPILQLCGTRGSGKTTTILRIFQPLLGYVDPRSYDVNTTQFVSLSLLGSTNCVPIAFSEFRAISGVDFTRFVLLAYDTGHDARGRADQTTRDYPLIAPFTIDGEDKLDDPAALERMIAVRMSPHDISEGSSPWTAFQQAASMDLRAFTLPYLRHCLSVDVRSLLSESEKAVHEAFPDRLPDRIRRNLIVTWAGVLCWNSFLATFEFTCFPIEGVSILGGVLDNVYSSRLGRAPTAADSFVEFVANQSAQSTQLFPWMLIDGILWFQLTPAFEAFTSSNSRQRKASLSKDAVRMQLGELKNDYTLDPRVMDMRGKRILAYGIDLKKAHDGGLDVPSSFKTGSVTINL